MSTSDRIAELYPEHEKLRALDGHNQTVGNFIEWLASQELTICTWYEADYEEQMEGEESRFVPTQFTTSQLLARFFGIDEWKLEAEKKAMLDSIVQRESRIE